jgi:hypothetical protein
MSSAGGTDDKTKLQATAIINDSYKYVMDLVTNGSVITDAYGNVIGFEVPCPSCKVVNVVSRRDNRITNQYSED